MCAILAGKNPHTGEHPAEDYSFATRFARKESAEAQPSHDNQV
jgi:hypothetical protein